MRQCACGLLKRLAFLRFSTRYLKNQSQGPGQDFFCVTRISQGQHSFSTLLHLLAFFSNTKNPRTTLYSSPKKYPWLSLPTSELPLSFVNNALTFFIILTCPLVVHTLSHSFKNYRLSLNTDQVLSLPNACSAVTYYAHTLYIWWIS